jgi:tripartite-type tricarboxylate transporter receptor subunit TctC
MKTEGRGSRVERRALLVAFCATAALVGGGSLAQEFPSKSLRLVVPFPPAGTTDTIARVLVPPLSKTLGQSVVIENRPGGNTVIGAELVLRAPADAHTLLFMAPSFTINPFVQAKLSFDPLKDFNGVTRLVYNPLIICVHPSLPVKTVKELVALARSRPGELTWAVSSVIGGGRLGGEQFKDAAKIDMTVVPYGGGAPAMTAVLGGHTSMLIGNMLDCAPYVASGRMRPIAVTSAARSDTLPNVPTVAESGYPGFDATNWFGAVVRSGAPRSAIERLGAEIGRALKLPEVSDALGKLGMVAAPMSPAEFDALIRREMEVNGKIIRKLNLKVE